MIEELTILVSNTMLIFVGLFILVGCIASIVDKWNDQINNSIHRELILLFVAAFFFALAMGVK